MTPETPSIKTRLLKAMCAHVLAHGLANLSLRPLARAAGTSDRMLIYHFASKDRLIEAVLGQLASDLETILSATIPAETSRSLADCCAETIRVLRADDVRRYLLVWLEIVAAAGLGDARFRAIGAEMLKMFLPWVEARLPASVADRPATAAMLLTLIEGAVVLDAVGMAPTVDMATAQLRGLDRLEGA